MPVDLAAQTASLKNDFGANKGPNAPAAFELDLYDKHPWYGGVLLAGYTPPTLTNDGVGVPTIVDGRAIGAFVTVNFTADLSTPAKWVVWRDPVTDLRWGVSELERELLGGAGTSEQFQPVIFYDDGSA